LIFSDDQCLKLKEVFSKKPYLTKNERNQLAKELDITETNVAVKEIPFFLSWRS